jgi:hypothetical protein
MVILAPEDRHLGISSTTNQHAPLWGEDRGVFYFCQEKFLVILCLSLKRWINEARVGRRGCFYRRHFSKVSIL